MAYKFKAHSDWKSVKLFPLAAQFKNYGTDALMCDVKAGFNVAVLSFPINMAYALIAGLPISYGIFGGVIASLIGLVFCRSIYVTLGPSNASAVILLSSFAVAGMVDEAARMAAVPSILALTGLFLILASVFKLTFVISYISRTVIISYVTVGALLIIANQMRNLFGFSYPQDFAPTTLVQTVRATIDCIGGLQPASLGMAAFTFAVFLPMKAFAKRLPAEGITMILAAAASYVCTAHFGMEIDRLSPVYADSWNASFPDFSVISLKQSASLALAIAILCAIEGVSIGKSLAAMKADRFDTNQEIFALGVANIGCAFGSGTLASGSMTRSTLAFYSGAKSTLFNLFTAIFTLVALALFGGAIEYVPKATLALIVVYTSFSLIKLKTIKTVLTSTFSDALVFLVTFMVGVFSSLDNAIYAGIALSILLFLKKASAPEVVEYSIGDDGELERIESKTPRSDPEISIVHVEGNMFFGASDVLQNQFRRIAGEENLKVLILKLRNAINFDATSVMDILELNRRMSQSDRRLILCEVREDIMRILKSSGAFSEIGRDNIFENDESNPTLSAARAVRSAREGFGADAPKLSIYAAKKAEGGQR